MLDLTQETHLKQVRAEKGIPDRLSLYRFSSDTQTLSSKKRVSSVLHLIVNTREKMEQTNK